MLELYGTFLSRVAEGRRLSRDEVERVAQGRVWSGARAQQIGLVDRLGGPLEALAEARTRAQLAADEPLVLRAMPATPEFLRWFARPGAARLSTPRGSGAGRATARAAHVVRGRSADA
jgi:protease-4